MSSDMDEGETVRSVETSSFLQVLGPGLITGASDDDPSGIGTYSQAGAQLGYGIGWTMLLTLPMMVAIQEISARVGRVTGQGIAGNVCRFYPAWLLHCIVALLFIANTINIAADLAAMADATRLLIGGATMLYVVLFGVLSALAQVFLNYRRYVSVLKWLTLSLFAYVIALAVVKVDWLAAVEGALIPHMRWNESYVTTVVAILGTTISPYLFFWQASQEAEDERIDPAKAPLLEEPLDAAMEFSRIRADTAIGMVFSNTIALAIMVVAAATLGAAGITDIATSSQAASALRPIAGPYAEAVFALGIVGTGLLAVPVLAGSAAYAVGEGRHWLVGLDRKPREALAFYCVLVLSIFIGVLLNFTSIDPIEALYWSAVVNGVLAVPVMVLLMLLSHRADVMGEFRIRGVLLSFGWLATLVMIGAVAAMIILALS